MKTIFTKNWLIGALVLSNLTTVGYFKIHLPKESSKRAPKSIQKETKLEPVQTDAGQYRGVLVTNMINEQNSELEICYNSFLKTHSENIEGKISVHWMITPEGKVDSAKIVNSELNDEKLESCVLDQVKGWVFTPPPDNQAMQVAHRFSFRKKKTDQLTF